jgi:hypothetical protein
MRIKITKALIFGLSVFAVNGQVDIQTNAGFLGVDLSLAPFNSILD